MIRSSEWAPLTSTAWRSDPARSSASAPKTVASWPSWAGATSRTWFPHWLGPEKRETWPEAGRFRSGVRGARGAPWGQHDARARISVEVAGCYGAGAVASLGAVERHPVARRGGRDRQRRGGAGGGGRGHARGPG